MMKTDLSSDDGRSQDDSPKKGNWRQRFLVNVSSNVAFIIAQAATHLWLTPFLIGHVGIAAFGMIPLVISITSYMAVLTTAFENAVSRFLAIDLGQRDRVLANKTFNTALFGAIGIILILCPLAITMSFVFPALFDVPPGWEGDASSLFIIVSVAFLVTVIGSTFSISPYFYSRFLSINIANFAGLFGRIGFIVVLFTYFPPHLWYVGGGALIAALVSLLGYIILWRRLTPELHIKISAFDRLRLRSLMGMGGWVVVNMLGGMLLGRVDLIVVNEFFGAAITGAYGAVVQLSLLMEYLVTAVSNVVRPVILIKYAQEDYAGIRSLANQSLKMLGIALALPVGLLCGFARPFLSIWLGPSFQYLNILLIVIVAHCSLNLSVRPLLFVQNAYNKVRWPGIVTLLSGLTNLGLAILFAAWGKWGYVGVAVAGALVWTAKNAVYVPMYTARIMGLPWWTFMPSLCFSVLGTLFVGLMSYALTLVLMPDSFLTLLGSAALVSLVYGAAAWTMGLSRSERRLVQDFLPFRTMQMGQAFLPK